MAAAKTARGRIAPLAEEDTLSLGERAYRRLRESIVQGVLPAGLKISERSVATELGISAQPVREALRRLEQDGMVVTLRGKTGWREVEIGRGSSDATCPVVALHGGGGSRARAAR